MEPESSKMEYDSAIGGFVNLPEYLPTFRYATSKVKEIQNLMDEIKNPKNTKLVFQTLPKHMRRRAMSHHPKRLPRKYRGIHKAQMAKCGPMKVTKRPSRKYRRKPSNMLKEYLRRQRKNIWLETHIWHAKRFHMINKWGYRLPLSSCDKTYRACYRAINSNCLIQDISYFACIQLEGEIEEIRQGFVKITSPECGLGICAKAYTNGKREGLIHLFKSTEYPNSALGKVSFIWQQKNLTAKKLWIFVHPSAYQDILLELIKVFELVSCKTIQSIVDHEGNIVECSEISNDEKPAPENTKTNNDLNLDSKSETGNISKNSSKIKKQLKYVTKTYSYQRTPEYKNSKTGVSLTELKDTLNRFRLTGPLSQATLTQALSCKLEQSNGPDNWFKTFLSSPENRKAHETQTDYWKNCKSINTPAQLIPNIIVALNIEDPRLNRPVKRLKAVPEVLNTDEKMFYEFSDNLAVSSIWDMDLCNSLAKNMMSNHELNCSRNAKCLIPGERCSFENDLQPIPILLIQRPGSQINSFKKLGYGCGWDVILPSGYGMSTWLSLIMWGARPGGLREISSLHKESGEDEFLPDSCAGRKELAERSQVLKERYFKLPPNKRCNYKKLAISSPFKLPLKKLVTEWGGSDNFYIIRNRQILKEILNAIRCNQKLPALDFSSLIQVSITMKTRGNPGDLSLICLPENQDLKKNYKQMRNVCNEPVFVEPLKKDDTEQERKQLKTEHKKLLKRLRAKRIREKRKKQEKCDKKIKISPANTSKLVSEQFEKMCELWLPEEPKTIRYQCSRQVLGYMTQCSFSLVEATVTGVGYISSKGLELLLENQKDNREKLCLVRGTKTRNYRLANFNINCQT